MEYELYRQLYQVLWRLGQRFRTPRVRYPHWRIVMIYLWAAIHERPTCWACQDRHWPPAAGGQALPDPATLSRRLRRPELRELLAVAERTWTERIEGSDVLAIDGKPLPVGGLSTDPDAANGYGAGKIARGYKLHAITDAGHVARVWTVRPLNEAEPVVAREILPQTPRATYLVGDGNYDRNPLYDQAGSHGMQLVTPLRMGKALGHRRHSRYRVHAHKRMSAESKRRLLAERTSVERFFAHLVLCPCGLKPLPPWVRTLRRVSLWVQAKILIFYTYKNIRRDSA